MVRNSAPPVALVCCLFHDYQSGTVFQNGSRVAPFWLHFFLSVCYYYMYYGLIHCKYFQILYQQRELIELNIIRPGVNKMQEQMVPPKRGDDKYYAVRGKKQDPAEELLDLITYYNYLHHQSGKTIYTAHISIHQEFPPSWIKGTYLLIIKTSLTDLNLNNRSWGLF